MTSTQKSLVFVLIITNLLLFCCGIPALVVIFDVGDAQSTLVSFIPTLPPTATRAPTATPTRPLPTVALEANWKLYTVSKDGFAMALPASWIYQELDPVTLQQAIQSLKQKNPQMAQRLESEGKKLMDAGIRFYGIEGASGSIVGDVSTSTNIIHASQPQAFTLDFIVARNVQDLESNSNVSKPVNHRRVPLPAGEAEELRYTTAFVLGGNQQSKIATTQYLILRGKEMYVVTFATAPTLDAKYFPTFEKIVRTFRWTP